YHNLSFEYPENAAYKQYVAKFYPDGHTELLSSFFEYLSIDARHLLTHNKFYVSKMLDALMKRMEDK
ncbi:MAG: hypothetical protein LBQ66_13805, partial [Planctomycetaceae bacterium]|nr:hypothetical protein [Planctomycetaceae bacterium]